MKSPLQFESLKAGALLLTSVVLLAFAPSAGAQGSDACSAAAGSSAITGTGTFPVNTVLFSTLLVSIVIIVGALTFFPALSLSPILEHFQMAAGQTF